MQATRTFSVEYLLAAGQALLVTVLWSSSWVIIKFGLEEITPLMFSGLRYVVASIILLFVILSKNNYRNHIMTFDRRKWLLLAVYGLIFIAITQGTVFVALDLLPAITVSLMLNFTTFIVVILSVIMLKEKSSPLQMIFILIGLVGIIIYFYPLNIPLNELVGLIVISIGVLANALAAILGRGINRAKHTPPIIITGLSMMFGAVALLMIGLLLEGISPLSLISLIYILWLSIVNTAFAFTLWNKTMQQLRAVDSTLINSTMLPQTVILALIFLGEMPEPLEWVGLALLAGSVMIVQMNQARRENTNEKS